MFFVCACACTAIRTALYRSATFHKTATVHEVSLRTLFLKSFLIMPRQFVLYFDTYNMQIQHCMLYVRVCVCVYTCLYVCVCVQCNSYSTLSPCIISYMGWLRSVGSIKV